MATISAHLQTKNLKFNFLKIVRKAFHLNNRKAKRELKVDNSNKLLHFCPVPTWFGIKLKKLLTFRHRFVHYVKNHVFCVTLLRQIAKIGCWAETLCTAVPSLAYSTAEYCTPVWCQPGDD